MQLSCTCCFPVSIPRKMLVGLIAAWFAALGCGAVERSHNAQHAMEDAAALAGLPAHDEHREHSEPHPVHDDTNCLIHALLHVPLAFAVAAPLMMAPDLPVAVAAQSAPAAVSVRIALRLACRGPPFSC